MNGTYHCIRYVGPLDGRKYTSDRARRFANARIRQTRASVVKYLVTPRSYLHPYHLIRRKLMQKE